MQETLGIVFQVLQPALSNLVLGGIHPFDSSGSWVLHEEFSSQANYSLTTEHRRVLAYGAALSSKFSFGC